jgi:hypothetical protein
VVLALLACRIDQPQARSGVVDAATGDGVAALSAAAVTASRRAGGAVAQFVVVTARQHALQLNFSIGLQPMFSSVLINLLQRRCTVADRDALDVAGSPSR